MPSPADLPPFDGNAYRKRVLAAIEARGGPEHSDPFELYDLPVSPDLPDAVVSTRIDAVWAFWQKQRDHPKYRGVVTAMLAIHREIADRMRSSEGRRWLAEQTVTERARREEQRYADVDAALHRLAERFGGIPADKVAGLRALALGAGGDDASFERRLRRHRVLAAQRPADRAPEASTYRQVRADLDELGQLDGAAPAASLYALLGLPPGAGQQQVRERRDALAARNRERRPDRRRALVDDLLAAVTTLLVEGDPGRYLDSVRSDVLVRLRPRVAAAVLVEDELTADDHAHLLGEAQAAGLDPARAASVLTQLAAELDVPTRSGPTRVTAPGATAGRAAEPAGPVWQRELTLARAALRAGRVLEARTRVGAARTAADGMLPPIRAVRDEVDAILAEAQQRWRSAVDAVMARRYAEATDLLDRLLTVAGDLPGPRGESAQALSAETGRRVADADRALRAAQRLSGADRELALLDVLATVTDHEPTRAALAAVGVAPATQVRARATPDGTLVTWRPSPSPGPVDYRVLRIGADGSARALGVTRSTSLEDGGRGAGAAYAVVARRAGIAAPEARTDRTDPPSAPAAPSSAPPAAAAAATAAAPAPAEAAAAAAVPASDAAPTPAAPHVAASTSAVPPAADVDDLAGPRPIPVASLVVGRYGRRIRLVYPPPAAGRVEVRRLPDGMPPPPPGTPVEDRDGLGVLVPSMGPGLAVDAIPPTSICEYVAVSVHGSAVTGACAAYVVLPDAADLQVVDGRLRWTWPAGCTEVVVLFRTDTPPTGPNDAVTVRRKVTNTRYEIDGGLPLTEPAPMHAAVHACVRRGGRLYVASAAPASARLWIS